MFVRKKMCMTLEFQPIWPVAYRIEGVRQSYISFTVPHMPFWFQFVFTYTFRMLFRVLFRTICQHTVGLKCTSMHSTIIIPVINISQINFDFFFQPYYHTSIIVFVYMLNWFIKETKAKIAISNLHFAIYTSLHSISHFSPSTYQPSFRANKFT